MHKNQNYDPNSLQTALAWGALILELCLECAGSKITHSFCFTTPLVDLHVKTSKNAPTTERIFSRFTIQQFGEKLN